MIIDKLCVNRVMMDESLVSAVKVSKFIRIPKWKSRIKNFEAGIRDY